MKAILTIKSGNKDNKNFTRIIDMTAEEYDYIKETAIAINSKGGENFIDVFVFQI